MSDDLGRSPARGRELRAGRDHAQLRAARASHRGLEPLGEGRRSVPRRAGRDLCDELLVELTKARYAGADRRAGRPARSARDRGSGRSGPTRWSASQIPLTEQRRILERLGFEVEERAGVVTVPTWRARDVTREVDLIEEVARIYGLERGAVHAAAAARDVRPPDARAAPQPASARTCSPAPASPRRTRPAWSPTASAGAVTACQTR